MAGRVILGDCLEVLSSRFEDGVFDLIYCDPPFFTQKDWGEFDDRWDGDLDLFLDWMKPRLVEIKRVLKPTGSLFLHCDPTASHYLKLVLDTLFGRDNFRNEIVWCYSGGGVPKKDYPRKHDVILRYAGKGRTFNVERKPYGEWYKPGSERKFRAENPGSNVPLHPDGTPVTDWWSDIKPLSHLHKEKVGYPTQKPVALLERIISASSNPGDVVLDPMCGSGTTLLAARKLGRNYVGIDANPKAVKLSKSRLAPPRQVEIGFDYDRKVVV